MHNRFDLMLVIGLVISVLFVVTLKSWMSPNVLKYPNFSNLPNHPNIKNLDNEDVANEKPITLLLGGDVMFGRMVMQTSLKNKNYSYPFEKISDFTGDSDIFFVNLENPIIENCSTTDSGMIFCALPQMLEGLDKAGVNVVNLANNHTGNYGQKGIKETEQFLNDKIILITGINNLVVKEFNSISIGFLGFDFTIKSPTERDYKLIRDSDPKINYLIVGVHWGEEYKDKANSNQRKWAREMIKNGADIIVGHHPHWVQDFECLSYPEIENDIYTQCVDTSSPLRCTCDGITGKPVYYSLGNLVFDQMWSEETKKGMLVKLELNKNRISKEERINTYMKNVAQPEITSNF